MRHGAWVAGKRPMEMRERSGIWEGGRLVRKCGEERSGKAHLGPCRAPFTSPTLRLLRLTACGLSGREGAPGGGARPAVRELQAGSTRRAWTQKGPTVCSVTALQTAPGVRGVRGVRGACRVRTEAHEYRARAACRHSGACRRRPSRRQHHSIVRGRSSRCRERRVITLPLHDM